MGSVLLFIFYISTCIYDSSYIFLSQLYFLLFLFLFLCSVLGWMELQKMIWFCMHDKIERWEYEALGHSAGVEDWEVAHL
jgi:hypothetical protein